MGILIIFTYIFLAVLGLHSCVGFSLVVAESGGLLHSSGAWVSHGGGFSCCRAQALGHAGLSVVAYGPSCPRACGILPVVVVQ